MTITGNEPTVAAAETAMVTRNICPDYLTLSESEFGVRQYEVTGGAMDQWNDVDDVFAALAKDFPTLTIEVSEHCEELYFPARKMRFRSEVKEERYGRVLDPDEYDTKSIEAVMELLQAKGMSEAAGLVSTLKNAREEW